MRATAQKFCAIWCVCICIQCDSERKRKMLWHDTKSSLCETHMQLTFLGSSIRATIVIAAWPIVFVAVVDIRLESNGIAMIDYIAFFLFQLIFFASHYFALLFFSSFFFLLFSQPIYVAENELEFHIILCFLCVQSQTANKTNKRWLEQATNRTCSLIILRVFFMLRFS